MRFTKRSGAQRPPRGEAVRLAAGLLMRDPHSFAIRTFVNGGRMLFAGGLFFTGKRHNLFKRNFEVYTEFDRLNGLQKGAKVRVSGMDAGEVLEAEVPNRPDGRFRVRVRIRQDFHVLVRRDSVATIRTPGLAGSSFMGIEKGTQDAPESGSVARYLARSHSI